MRVSGVGKPLMAGIIKASVIERLSKGMINGRAYNFQSEMDFEKKEKLAIVGILFELDVLQLR